MRIQPGVDDHLTYVEGRAPTGTLRRIVNPLDPIRGVGRGAGLRDRPVAGVGGGDRGRARRRHPARAGPDGHPGRPWQPGRSRRGRRGRRAVRRPRPGRPVLDGRCVAGPAGLPRPDPPRPPGRRLGRAVTGRVRRPPRRDERHALSGPLHVAVPRRSRAPEVSGHGQARRGPPAPGEHVPGRRHGPRRDHPAQRPPAVDGGLDDALGQRDDAPGRHRGRPDRGRRRGPGDGHPARRRAAPPEPGAVARPRRLHRPGHRLGGGRRVAPDPARGGAGRPRGGAPPPDRAAPDLDPRRARDRPGGDPADRAGGRPDGRRRAARTRSRERRGPAAVDPAAAARRDRHRPRHRGRVPPARSRDEQRRERGHGTGLGPAHRRGAGPRRAWRPA